MPYWFDGNNLMGRSAADARKDLKIRDAFLSSLWTHRRSGGGRFLVYFDGDDPGRSALPPGIAVTYSAPESADAVIVRRLREIQRPFEVIIVTNDHELAARCRAAGAGTLTWAQFIAKMQSRARSAARHKHEGDDDIAIDVDEWIQYFGLDKK